MKYKAEEELKGIAAEIAVEPDFDDRERPEHSTLTEKVAITPWNLMRIIGTRKPPRASAGIT